MSPYIFDEKKGIHIIDLNKTLVKLQDASNAVNQIAKSGRKILFVATKKQAKEIISTKVSEVNMPFVTERWPGGMLTNFKTTRKTIKKMTSIDKMMKDGTANHLSKRERLQLTRQRDKIDKIFGSISDMNRLPAAIFIVDVKKEHIAVAEAKNLNIPIFAMVDTNSSPEGIDFIIPSNDDATKSIDLIITNLCDSIKEGLGERKETKDKIAQEKAARDAKKEAEKISKEDNQEKEEVKS
jgi:small subunit ribosomal protein S2